MRLKNAYKDRDSCIEFLRGEVLDKETMDELENDDRTRSHQRLEESEAVMKQLRQVKMNVSALRQIIESRGTGADYVDKLRRAMDAAENEVYVAREAHRERLEMISAEERTISRELGDVERMIQSWMNASTRPQSAQEGRGRGASRERPDELMTIGSRVETAFQPTELPPEVCVSDRLKPCPAIGRLLRRACGNPHTTLPHTPTHPRTHTQPYAAPLVARRFLTLHAAPPQVLAVERILREEGGVTGGWDERDHERFLRYRTQHPGQPRAYILKTAGPRRQSGAAPRRGLWARLAARAPSRKARTRAFSAPVRVRTLPKTGPPGPRTERGRRAGYGAGRGAAAQGTCRGTTRRRWRRTSGSAIGCGSSGIWKRSLPSTGRIRCGRSRCCSSAAWASS